MTEPDLVNRLAGIGPDSPRARARQDRADVARHTQGAYEALIEPPDPGKLTPAERAAIARDVAMLNQDPALAAHYGALLGARGGEPEGARWAAIAAHVEMVTSRPREASRAAIENLRAASLGEGEIVTLSQIVAFVSYQTRVISGLRLMETDRG